MKNFKISENFTMTAEEIAAYNLLPDNMPNIKLSASELTLVKELYRKYITRHIDNQGYNSPLWENELKEKWPSGPRVKEHEAKRFILNQLVECNSERRKEMTADVAADYFLACLHWKELCQKVIKAAYAG